MTIVTPSRPARPVVVEVEGGPQVETVRRSGRPGPQGEPGPAGPGVPVGGTTGQVLAKASATDYATEWVDASAGSVAWADVTDKPTFATVATSGAYSDLTGIPATFTPSAHTHPASAISDSTTAGRSMLTAADAAAQRALLNVANGATANATATGSAVLDFGAAPGTNTAEITVTTPIPSGAAVRAWFQSEGNADHNEIEHRLIFPSRVGLTCGEINAGAGFTIFAETELRLTGDVTCRWQWSA
jgi:hypothetical protein